MRIEREKVMTTTQANQKQRKKQKKKKNNLKTINSRKSTYIDS